MTITVQRLRRELRRAMHSRGLPFDGQELERPAGKLESWSGEHAVRRPFVLHISATKRRHGTLDADGIPIVAHKLAAAADVAAELGMRLRPIGHHTRAEGGRKREPLHNWSPLHLDPSAPKGVLYVSFERLEGILDLDHRRKTVRVLCGTRIDDLARAVHDPGTMSRRTAPWLGSGSAPSGPPLTMPAIPAPGVLSVGGALAIGAHGTRMSVADGFGWPGTLSGTVDAATIIAWNPETERYEPRRLRRGEPELAFASASLGRIIMVDVTLRLVRDYPMSLRLESFAGSELFGEGPRSLRSLLRRQSAEVLAFRPDDDDDDPTCPVVLWKRVRGTPLPPWPRTHGLNRMVRVSSLVQGLTGRMKVDDLAGMARWNAERTIKRLRRDPTPNAPAAAQRMYVASDTMRVEPLGWALLLPRKDINRATRALFDVYRHKLRKPTTPARSQHDVALELRLADPDWTRQPKGALPPTLSAGAPVAGRTPDDRVVMWVNVLATQSDLTRRLRGRHLTVFEKALRTMAADNRGWLARPEWSKGWAYTRSGAWTLPNKKLHAMLAEAWPGGPRQPSSWRFARRMAWTLDPHGTFSSPFHDRVLPR